MTAPIPSSAPMHACMVKLSGNAALDVLRGAIDDVAPDRPDRRELIRCFTERWAAEVEAAAHCASAPPAAQPVACHCEMCDPIRIELDADGHLHSTNMRMIVCAICGNKRCPHATDHRLACTNSNDRGQDGSSYGPTRAVFVSAAITAPAAKDSPSDAAPQVSTAREVRPEKGGVGTDVAPAAGNLLIAIEEALASIEAGMVTGAADTLREAVSSAGSESDAAPTARRIEDCPELNLSNYDVDDVARLNEWAVRADSVIDMLYQRIALHGIGLPHAEPRREGQDEV